MEKINFDVLVIGAGPGGMTAAIYAARGNLKTAIIEKGAPGGLMVTTSKVENYPGFKSLHGADLSLKMFEHVKVSGAIYLSGTVVGIKTYNESDQKIQLLSGNIIEAKKVIIASGTTPIVPNIQHITKFIDKGVSFCAICDGPLYKNKIVAVIGGGNSAIEESKYLSSIAKEVHIYIMDDFFHAEPKLVSDLKKAKNVFLHMKSVIVDFIGDDVLNTIKISENGKIYKQKVAAVFPYIGMNPISSFTKGLNITDKNGFIETDELMETSSKGIYAVGDIRVKNIRQIATAISDGAIAGKIIVNKID